MHGPPTPPTPDLTETEFHQLEAHGWLDSDIRVGDRFRHADGANFGPTPSAEAAVWMDWLAAGVADPALSNALRTTAGQARAAVAPKNYARSGIGHVWHPTATLVYGAVADNVGAVRTLGQQLLAQYQGDGVIRYQAPANGPDYSETHWSQEANGLVGEIQRSPVRSEQPVEEITLIPMGCARLRISQFPTIGEGPEAQTWSSLPLPPTASFQNRSDPLSALHDRVEPRSSDDQNIPRFTWWDHRGSREWVQYTFPEPRKFSWVEVYWFDDTSRGGGCRVPAAWKVQWLDGSTWKDVAAAGGKYTTKTNQYNRVTFEPVTTTAIRLDVQLGAGVSGGILEWKYGE